MTKVVLNVLPPARLDTPSAALSILKGFLRHHGIPATVVYWNRLLDSLLPPFERNTDTIHFDLLPFLYLIAGEYGDDIARSKANAVIKAELPVHDLLNNNSDYLTGTRSTVDSAVANELPKHAHGGPLLFGIPCKYEQWIPGIVLARYIKDYFPEAGIVLGGLRNRDKAESVMNTCGLFDFAIWGEGEYPLMELCRALEGATGGLASIPRLVYREGNSLRHSDTETGRFFDMNSGISPDYDDYFDRPAAAGSRDRPVIFPLESSRGCAWNACRFCVYGEGYKARKKEPAVLKAEIEHLREKYDARYFAFMDNDIVGNDVAGLENILDNLIAIRQKSDVEFIAEIVHKGLTASVLAKFPRAGLGRIHVGYEALSNGLLSKMRKRTDFSDNLFLVKFARKFGIRLPSANVICGAVGETDYDVLESIDNLHFLRFFLDKAFLRHNLIPLRLAKHSGFYNMIAKEDLNQWSENTIFHLLPEKLVEGVDRFSLFDFAGRRNLLWEVFSKLNDFYYHHAYSYSVHPQVNGVLYREFFDGEPVAELELKGVAFHILRETNSRMMDLRSLMDVLAKCDEEVDGRAVRAVLDRLREKHLVYFGDQYRSIVSIINVDQEDGTVSGPAGR